MSESPEPSRNWHRRPCSHSRTAESPAAILAGGFVRLAFPGAATHPESPRDLAPAAILASRLVRRSLRTSGTWPGMAHDSRKRSTISSYHPSVSSRQGRRPFPRWTHAIERVSMCAPHFGCVGAPSRTRSSAIITDCQIAKEPPHLINGKLFGPSRGFSGTFSNFDNWQPRSRTAGRRMTPLLESLRSRRSCTDFDGGDHDRSGAGPSTARRV